jgi:hypothetical protein
MLDLEKRVRSFLVATPRPTKIVVHCEDGETHELGPAKAGTTWAGIARSIMALKPESVQAFIGDRLERAMECDESSSERVNVAQPSVLSNDPESARIMHFANLLHRAYEHSTNIAFERLCEVFDMVNARAVATETRLERLETAYRNELRRQLDDERDSLEDERAEAERLAAEAQTSPIAKLAEMATPFLTGMQQGASEPKPPNGAKS